MKSTFMRVWGGPLLVGVLTASGLISALLGDGEWDWLSAVLLAVPVGLCLFYSARHNRR